MNIQLNYPFSDEYEFETMLARIDQDRRRADDIKSGKGFIISAPQGIKKDIKNQDGIYSSRYGSNSITDVDSFNGLYRCNCGMKRGSINHGEWCDICGSRVKYVGDDVSITGYLVLKDKYWIIHPNIYRTLEAFIGAQRLNRIIDPAIEVDCDGKYKPVISNKKDEPFKGIGMLEFKERYDEILDYYYYKYPQKKLYYDDLKNVKPITFTHTVSVYSSLLRPSRIDDGSLKYEACNDQFSMLSSLVYKCNRDRLRMDQKLKEKLKILYDIQEQLNTVYFEIKEMLARKRGDIRSAVGGRHSFSSRAVIKQDVSLQCDQVKLPFHALCELLQQVIINILFKSYNFTYADAYKKWFKAQVTGNDTVVYNIIDGLIKDSDEGLPVLINRNPTISYGGILFVHCVGINMDYTMSLSLLVLKILCADFDGDSLNVLFLYNQDFIRVCSNVLSPRRMFISRNDGRCNSDMLFSRDVMINANALKSLCEYTPEQVERIKRLQAMEN
jgi:hypothetical protein